MRRPPVLVHVQSPPNIPRTDHPTALGAGVDISRTPAELLENMVEIHAFGLHRGASSANLGRGHEILGRSIRLRPSDAANVQHKARYTLQ